MNAANVWRRGAQPEDRCSRRALLAAASAAPLVAGCDRILSFAAELMGDEIPSSFDAPVTADLDPTYHLLNRSSFGVRPGDLEKARVMGRDTYLDWQLSPDVIDDAACDLRTSSIDSSNAPPSLAFEFPPEQVESELGRYAVLRATYSRRQLFEVMVEVWSDHFHVAIGKTLCRHLTPSYYRGVARRHAFGSFRDLLGASALSAAMLVYLDGRDNKRQSETDRSISPQPGGPNENYARELLELHTLGVHGGYSQKDIMEAARCLTGFVVKETWAPGEVEFVSALHDDGEKVVLGQVIPAGGGRADVDKLLDIVAEHPSTALHISEKLCRAFVADDPPRNLVEGAAATFTASNGDMRRVVRAILTSEDLAAAKAWKVKRPFRFVVSALRAIGADTHAKEALLPWLQRMGHAAFAWPTPDGYPMRGGPWLNTLLTRFQFAFELARGSIAGTRVDIDRLGKACGADRQPERLVAHCFGRTPRTDEMASLAAENLPETLAMALASPAFQRF